MGQWKQCALGMEEGATSQGLQEATRWNCQETDSRREPVGETRFCGHLDSSS